MLFLSSTAFILIWFDISIFIFLKFIILGGLQYKGNAGDNDLNNIGTGLYTLEGAENILSGSTIFGTLIVVKGSPTSLNHMGVFQIVYDINGKGVFYREQWAVGTWNTWKKITTGIPDFYKDYADIVSLTSGVKKAMRVSQNTLVVPANGSNSELGLQENPFTIIKADTSNFNGCIVLLCDHANFMVLGNFGGFNDWVALRASGGKLVIQNKTGVQLRLPVFTFVG